MHKMNTENIEEDFSPHQSLQVMAEMIEKVQNDKIRRLAKKRVAFKKAVVITAFISLMLILVWYFTTGPQSYFWPMWPMFGFVFSLLVQYLEAYSGTTFFSEDKEYKKLKSKQSS